MAYRNLFFDLDNTLWAFSENAYDTFQEVYNLHRLDRFFNSFEEFFDIYEEENLKLWKLYEAGSITRDELNYRRFRYPLQVAGVGDLSLADDYSADFFRIIKTKKRLMPHAIETLDYLYPRYNLFILSNGFKDLQYAKMRSGSIDRYFKKVILSDEINVNKPNKELFLYALESTGSNIEQSIMIGDNFDVDIRGAYQCGLAQVYYNISDENEYPFQPTYLIKDLRELTTIF
jgi:YjjG family noncanonical pyrimidine nucleotidase